MFCLSIYIVGPAFLAPGDPRATCKRKAGSFVDSFAIQSSIPRMSSSRTRFHNGSLSQDCVLGDSASLQLNVRAPTQSGRAS